MHKNFDDKLIVGQCVYCKQQMHGLSLGTSKQL